MRISKWWFRTRKDNKIHKTLLSLEPKSGYSTRCECNKCMIRFNREIRTKDFKLCPSCRIAVRNRTDDARQRSSEVFKKYYSDEKNRNKHSIMVADRFLDEKYKKQHKEACRKRSADPIYRKKLSDNAARGKQHAINTSCGKQGISIDKFNGFITNLDIRERERCKTTVGKQCLQKASFICEICSKQGKLNAHHKDGWHWAKDKRFDLNNLVCLCHGCHSQFHKEYGNKWNTKEQFEEYRLKKRNI